MKNLVSKSLAVFALSAVLIIGADAASAHDHDGGNGSRDQAACGGASSLSDAQRQLLHETMKSVFEKDKALIEQMHKLHHDMHEVVVADNFNPKAYMILKGKMEALHAKIAHDRAEAFASIAGQFSPEQREMLMRRHHHHHGHKGHDGWQHRSDGDHEDGWHHHDWQGQSGEGSPVTNDMPASGPNDNYPPYSPR